MLVGLQAPGRSTSTGRSGTKSHHPTAESAGELVEDRTQEARPGPFQGPSPESSASFGMAGYCDLPDQDKIVIKCSVLLVKLPSRYHVYRLGLWQSTRQPRADIFSGF